MFVGQGSSRKLKYLFILLLAIDLFDQQTLAIDQRWVSSQAQLTVDLI